MHLNLAPTSFANYPEGPAGIRATLRQMAAFARAGKHDPVIRQFTAQLVSALPQKAFLAEIHTVFLFVRDRIRYVLDIDDVETLQWPRFTLTRGYGDCDDKSMLLAAMLLTIGNRVQFIAVGFEPDVYEHVLVQCLTPGESPSVPDNWISLDATELQPMGWFPPDIRATMIQRV